MIKLKHANVTYMHRGSQDPLSSTTPNVSTLCLTDIIVCDEISHVFPLHICMLETIKH